MDGQTRESLHDPNDTSEQSSGQLDSEGEHEEHNTLNSELQTGGNAVVVSESQPLKDIEVQLPVIGTVFQSEIEAYDYYNAYARSSGFSIRRSKMVMRKDKTVTRRVFCCSKEGFRCKHPRGNPMKPRPVTRTGCKARMDIHLKDGKYVVSGFVEEHNHPFARPSESHMLRSQRKLQDPQTFDIENILSYLHEEIEVPQDLNLEDGNYTDYPSQRWCYEILKKAQEDKKKIRELSTELQRERRQSAVYREQLLLVLKEMEDHTNHLSRQVESIVDNVKPLEPRGSKELS